MPSISTWRAVLPERENALIQHPQQKITHPNPLPPRKKKGEKRFPSCLFSKKSETTGRKQAPHPKNRRRTETTEALPFKGSLAPKSRRHSQRECPNKKRHTHTHTWVWLKIKQEGHTAEFWYPCFHLPIGLAPFRLLFLVFFDFAAATFPPPRGSLPSQKKVAAQRKPRMSAARGGGGPGRLGGLQRRLRHPRRRLRGAGGLRGAAGAGKAGADGRQGAGGRAERAELGERESRTCPGEGEKRRGASQAAPSFFLLLLFLLFFSLPSSRRKVLRECQRWWTQDCQEWGQSLVVGSVWVPFFFALKGNGLCSSVVLVALVCIMFFAPCLVGFKRGTDVDACFGFVGGECIPFLIRVTFFGELPTDFTQPSVSPPLTSRNVVL